MAVSPAILTYHDAIEHGVAFLGGPADAVARNDVYAAVQSAYRFVAYNTREWNTFKDYERITTVAPYDTGTITYDHTGGTYERELTLATGTWPTWAAFGWVRIAGVDYEVEDRKSSTVITLTERSNPGADVAAGTSYSIFRDTYPLSPDVTKIFEPEHEQYFGMTYMSYPGWVQMRKRTNVASTPYYFAFGRDRNYVGSYAVYLWPSPSEAKTIDIPVVRRPRPIKVSGLETADYGTASTSGTTVTGSSTAFSGTRHTGSIIRFYDSTNYPTGLDGVYPPVEERSVMAVTSSTAITADDTMNTLSSVKFRISDRVDLHEYLWNLFLTTIRLELAKRKRQDAVKFLAEEQYTEMRRACEADSQFLGVRCGRPIGGMDGWRNQVIVTAGNYTEQ